ncbi:lipid-A-disaccharide synthase [Mesorhizobium sp. BAC0120]|uniref:lipid-A-disaccharide synthase n=1 Tax=Mesorhizobium sp. BAC0120 TaxID=3090670 RepID=UPI00298BD930|nr:lipid-A-disaccharide synthase [Mesorhizobium sp. BAC0120]MDW6022825.1 lipid-A-disaccharide synthase [Mesorhizobium sp. BAC0120]
MNSTARPFRLAVVAGEESGDLLGADLVRALHSMTGAPVELVGVGGRHLQEEGLKSLFDPAEIALMGISAVLRDLPRLLRRIGETARAIAAAKPDCLVTIDSPDFGLRVARKVRAAASAIPIVHYVCPSVWAWRPGRAPAMRPHVDHILCLLPFEPEALERIGGPAGTFVGHRLSHDAGLVAAVEAQRQRRLPSDGEPSTLLVLPGSRKGEVSRLIQPFRGALDVLSRRGHRLRVLMPTVPHVQPMIEAAVADWPERPEVIGDVAGKWRAFGEADAALSASGTVTLELALVGVPLVACYKLDWLANSIRFLVTAWSASLPNLIADRPVVPELYNDIVRPEHVARQVEALLSDTQLRRWQQDGFAEIRRRLSTDRPSGEIAADVVLRTVEERSRKMAL